MKLAIVHDWLTGFAGAEQVLLAVHEMYPDAPIYTSLYNPDKTKQFKDAKVIPSYLQKIPGMVKRDKLAIPLMPAAFESFDLKEFDTILSITGGFAKGVITHPGQRHICYCNTPIRYAWRLGGDNRNAGKWDSALREMAMHKMRQWDVVSAIRPDEIISNSENIRERVSKIYRRESTVLAPPVSIERFEMSEVSDDYFLTVGRMVAYKRGDLIIEACKKANKKLKIVGTGPEEARFKKLAEGAPWIEFMGRVSDEELKHIYGHAKAFIFAAEEDAGIVPVEAMACGKPVIAYRKGGVLDVLVDGVHGLYYNEQNADSLIDAMNRFDSVRFDPKVIRKHAESYATDIFKEKLRKIIER